MKKLLFYFTFIALPFVSAELLQVLDIGKIKGFQNLFWGSIFGVGWFVADYVRGFSDTLTNLIGFFVWPFFVCFILYRWGAIAWNSHNVRMHCAMLFFSLLIVVTYKTSVDPPFSHLPLFFAMLNAAF